MTRTTLLLAPIVAALAIGAGSFAGSIAGLLLIGAIAGAGGIAGCCFRVVSIA